ncbi:hypothetical protein EV667_3119 [Ancylobacter aquaticus]|uniref:DUF2306 domain-containing protein n=1 Tax=Ancylobacter aquaticus TaxID=100 RepID=A0A4R1I8H5_ANCAQ|nr:hypothetical protein [Ancylobacter aquaticus]TCK29099.1 hypothetical protein EV667_3119 [Ancylobacter aquaticus]
MFDPTTWTGFHTWLSLIAIATGFVVLADLIAGRDRRWWTATFLATAVATSATGFGFAFNGVLPSHIVGIVALVVLAVTVPARYHFHRSGRWNLVYAVGIVASQWLLVFVAIAQVFAKVPAVHALAPTQAEPPFAIAQGVVLLLFVLAGVAALRGSRPSALPA